MAEKYWVVEFRFPIQVNSATSAMDAYKKASKILESRFGFQLSAWFCRVFEYSENSTGPAEEWFCNPGGSKFRRKNQNIQHESIEDS